MLPQYLCIGMSQAEFWHGAPGLARAYWRAEELRRERAYTDEWRLGVYIVEAMLTASDAFREVSKGIGHQYPKAPLFGKLAEGQDGEESAMEAGKEAFLRMARAANAKLAGEVPHSEE